MKRLQIVKWLMLIAVMLMAMETSSDVPRPSYSYHALPRSAWEAKIQMLDQEKQQQEREKKIQEFFEKTGMRKLQSILHKSSPVGYVILILSPLVLGSIVGMCLSRYIRFRRGKYVIATVLVSGPLLVSIFLFGLNFCGLEQNRLVLSSSAHEALIGSKNFYRHLDITVVPKLGETYEQYLERVEEYKNPKSKCDRCGNMSSTGHSWHGSFICSRCKDEESRWKRCPKCARMMQWGSGGKGYCKYCDYTIDGRPCPECTRPMQYRWREWNCGHCNLTIIDEVML